MWLSWLVLAPSVLVLTAHTEVSHLRFPIDTVLYSYSAR